MDRVHGWRMFSPRRDPGRWVRLVASRWWYFFPLVYCLAGLIDPALTYRSTPFSRICEILALCVCVARYCTPWILAPGSILARGWLVLAGQWSLLIVFRAVGYSASDLTGWASLALPVLVYVPSLTVLIACFVSLPLSHRRRNSLLLDWVVASISLTVIVTVLLRLIAAPAAPAADVLDALFVGGDLSTLYAMVLIRDQQPARWARLWSSLAIGMVAIALADLAWVLYRSSALPLLLIGPANGVSWLVFSRAALILPDETHRPDPSRLLIDSAVGQALPFLLLLGGLGLALLLDHPALALPLLTLTLIRIGVELRESRGLLRRIDDSRQAEAAARADAEQLRGLVRSSIHDLRSPIDGAAGILALLEANPDSPQRGRLLELLGSQLVEANGQMTDLLDRARAGAGKPAPLRSVALAPIVAAEIDRARRLAADRGRIELAQGDAALRAWGDGRQIGRVLANLLRNAVEHGGAQISVEVSADERQVRLVVRDNGPGFPAALVSRGPARHEPAGWRAAGYGFGLIGVAANLALMEGSLALENNPGAQATVTLRRAEEDG